MEFGGRWVMETVFEKCWDKDKVDSFCSCIAGVEPADPVTQAFCDSAKADKNVSDDDLIELKMRFMDLKHDACCDCE